MELQDEPLPIKEGFIFDSPDIKKIDKAVQATINKMAVAYLQILEIQGINPIFMTAKELPDYEDIAIKDCEQYSIGDYLSNILFGDEDE